jgi:3-hydroxyacyl-CoA dehydrogenase
MEWVGILGAGTMGSAIAQVFDYAGYRVRLVDTKPESLQRATTMTKNSL